MRSRPSWSQMAARPSAMPCCSASRAGSSSGRAATNPASMGGYSDQKTTSSLVGK